MLSKNQRISRNRLNYLLKKGLRITNQFFQVKYGLNKGSNNRYSVVVSKKIQKLAVDRNRLRRQIYEAILQLNIPTETRFDSIITVKNSLDNLNYQEIITQLQTLFDQISLQINQNHG